MSARRPGQTRELVAACIAWPSIIVTVASFVGLFFDPDQARWFLGVGLAGINTAIGIGNAPMKRALAIALLLWLRPWTRRARAFLDRKPEP